MGFKGKLSRSSFWVVECVGMGVGVGVVDVGSRDER